VKKVPVFPGFGNLALFRARADAIEEWIHVRGGIAWRLDRSGRIIRMDYHRVLKKRESAEHALPAGRVFITLEAAKHHELLGHRENKGAKTGHIVLRGIGGVAFHRDLGGADEDLSNTRTFLGTIGFMEKAHKEQRTMFDNKILIPVRISFWRGAGNSVKMRPPIDSCMPWQRLRICDTQRERRLGSMRLPRAGGRIECNLASRSDVCVRGTDDMWGPRNQQNCGAFIGRKEKKKKAPKKTKEKRQLFSNQTSAIYKE
jgi:hypothetical protein